MNNRDLLILNKIIQYSEQITATIDRFNLTQKSFEEDFVAKNAISMCILQIGELVGKLSDDFKSEYNNIPWRDIKAMRNIAAHNYGEIDIDILWETATGDIPELRMFCTKVLEK